MYINGFNYGYLVIPNLEYDLSLRKAHVRERWSAFLNIQEPVSTELRGGQEYLIPTTQEHGSWRFILQCSVT